MRNLKPKATARIGRRSFSFGQLEDTGLDVKGDARLGLFVAAKATGRNISVEFAKL